MSARCGEKYTTENTTLTRYKNSHPHCHSSLHISSKSLFRWKDSSCSRSTLCLDDESPSHMGSGAGPETGPDTVRRTVKQLQAGTLGRPGQTPTRASAMPGFRPPPCSRPVRRISVSKVALRGFRAALQEGSPQKSTSSPPPPAVGLEAFKD